ncbi:hypothetical protein [Mycobacterium sp. URHB0021]
MSATDDFGGPARLRARATCQLSRDRGHRGKLVEGITAFADGPEEMRKAVRKNVELGADLAKLSMAGEEINRQPARRGQLLIR